MKISAYYSTDLQSWVRMEKQEDGEYCHTSGYATEKEALAKSNEKTKEHVSN